MHTLVTEAKTPQWLCRSNKHQSIYNQLLEMRRVHVTLVKPDNSLSLFAEFSYENSFNLDIRRNMLSDILIYDLNDRPNNESIIEAQVSETLFVNKVRFGISKRWKKSGFGLKLMTSFFDSNLFSFRFSIACVHSRP